MGLFSAIFNSVDLFNTMWANVGRSLHLMSQVFSHSVWLYTWSAGLISVIDHWLYTWSAGLISVIDHSLYTWSSGLISVTDHWLYTWSAGLISVTDHWLYTWSEVTHSQTQWGILLKVSSLLSQVSSFKAASSVERAVDDCEIWRVAPQYDFWGTRSI